MKKKWLKEEKGARRERKRSGRDNQAAKRLLKTQKARKGGGRTDFTLPYLLIAKGEKGKETRRTRKRIGECPYTKEKGGWPTNGSETVKPGIPSNTTKKKFKKKGSKKNNTLERTSERQESARVGRWPVLLGIRRTKMGARRANGKEGHRPR